MKYYLSIVMVLVVFPFYFYSDAFAVTKCGADVVAHIPFGHKMIYTSSPGHFGPWKQARFLFYKEKECQSCRIKGRLLLEGNMAKRASIDLPEINQFDNQTVDTIGIKSVLYVNVDKDRENEALVLVEGYRRGPGGHSIIRIAALDWKGNRVRAMPGLEKYFYDRVTDAADVRPMLRFMKSITGKFAVNTKNISADLTLSLTPQGNIVAVWSSVYGKAHVCDRVTFNINPVKPGKAHLMRWSDEKGSDITFATVTVTGKKAAIRFLYDPVLCDCGAGHPRFVVLKKVQ